MNPPQSMLDALAGPAPPAALDVMSFNLKFASDQEPHSWARRRPVTRALLAQERPDLLGTQEGLYPQLSEIHADLGDDYQYVGLGREGGSRGEYVAIFFDRRRLQPLAYDHFWLSGTPDVIGSNTWGGGSIRMVTWVRFLDRRTGGQFYAVNTHLDNASGSARALSAGLIRDQLAALEPALPYLLTGDFNTPAGGADPVYSALVTSAGARDTWRVAQARSAGFGTCHEYQPPVPDGARIDWIVASAGISVLAAAINPHQDADQFPSDHTPVQARVLLPGDQG